MEQPKGFSNGNGKSNGIENEIINNVLDQNLIAYSFYQDMIDNKDGADVFFDSSSNIPISTTTYGNQQISRNLLIKNTRWITFNIPAIDQLSRSNKFVKNATNYLSSKPLINGIDVNIAELSSAQTFELKTFIKNRYSELKTWLNKGITYGGSGGLLTFYGDDNRDLSKPLIISKIKKDSFAGIKPLSRWFQIEPDLESPLIQGVDPDRGIYTADMVGMPEYYNVNLSGGMIGDPRRANLKVHVSRLIIFNEELPSYIETQVERYWGASIIEVAWEDLISDQRLWKATTKTFEKNNMASIGIDGLGLTAAETSGHTKSLITSRLAVLNSGSKNGVAIFDKKDVFEFVNAQLNGYAEILQINERRLAGAFKGVPTWVLFPDNHTPDKDTLHLQSLPVLQDYQEFHIRPALNKILTVAIKSLFNIKVLNPNFVFNPIETQTLKDKADVFKSMSEAVSNLYEIGLDKASVLTMLDDFNKNPENISQNIHEGYREKIIKDADEGIYHTQVSDQIELAKALNQFSGNEDDDADDGNDKSGKGFSGVEHPLSKGGGKEGGDPTKRKGLFKKNPLNPKKKRKD